MDPGRFWEELKRRRVVRATVAYVVLAFGIIEAAGMLVDNLGLAASINTIITVVMILGLPVTIVFAWIFDLSPSGIEHTADLPEKAGVSQRNRQAADPAALPPPADTALASICVMPFEVLSADPEDRFIAQGVGAEITSALSKVSDVRVVPHAATAGENSDLRALASRLQVRYVLTGNLRRHGEKVRIIVGLTDAVGGSQLWSETYHRVLEDVMEVEEEIAGAIVGSVGGEQLRAQIRQANEGETRNPTAWSLVHKARSYILDYSRESLESAESFARQALALDSGYAAAHAALAAVLSERVTSGISDGADADLAEAVKAIETATAITPGDPFVLKLAGNVWKYAGQHERAVESLRHAVEISPFDLGAWGYLGGALASSGDAEELAEAQEVLDRILDMAPQHPGAGFWWHHKAVAYTCMGQYAEAVECGRRALSRLPKVAWAWFMQANALAMTEQPDKARSAMERAAAANPEYSLDEFSAFVNRSSATTAAAGKRLAGLRSLAAG